MAERESGKGGKAKMLWQLAMLATVWGIWKTCNRKVFDGVLLDPGFASDSIRRHIATWAVSLRAFKTARAIDIWRVASQYIS